MTIPENYRKPILIAVIVHVILLCVLIFSFGPTLFRMPPSGAAKTVHATAVSEASVQAAVHQAQQQSVMQKKAAMLAQEKIIEEKKAAEAAAQAVIEKAAAEKVAAQKAAAQKALVLQEQKMAAIKIAAEKKEAEKKAAEKKIKEQQLAKQKALQLQQKKIAQQKLAAALKAEAATALKKAAKQKQQQLAQEQKKLQQELMQQQISSDQKTISSTVSQAQQGAIDKYKAEILSAIQSNWHIDQINAKLKCIYTVQLAPDGTVLSIQLNKSSGDTALDQSAKQAITLASPLPVPHNPALFNHFRQLVLTLSPQGVLQSVGTA